MSRRVSQNLRKRPELKLIAQQVKLDQIWNQKIHIHGFQVIAATVILYALQVTAAWIHRLEVRPMKMVIATLVSRLCRDYLFTKDRLIIIISLLATESTWMGPLWWRRRSLASK